MNNVKVWVNKGIETEASSNFNDALIFNINIPHKSNLLSNLRDGLYNLGVKHLPSLYEDLFILALSIFAIDKRVSRSTFPDNWTRCLQTSIPMIEIDSWNSVKTDLEQMLSYLSGDKWSIEFRKVENDTIYKSTKKTEPARPAFLDSINAVSLFSGGLDSFCGAYELLSAERNTLFVGFQEYGKLAKRQSELIDNLNHAFPDVLKFLFTFSAKAFQPYGEHNIKPENTSRSRSFLFLCTAICLAETVGNDIPVYIPENGFIGLNLPMTSGRKGSCSTRTTHPFFIRELNRVLGKIGIAHAVVNPYAFQTKREMVQKFCDNESFVDGISKTISCSHPCNERWKGKPEPENCGYCYPCMIRQSSLLDLELSSDNYSYNIIDQNYLNASTIAKRSDLVDLLSSVKYATTASDELLLKKIRFTGKLTSEEALSFLRVYKSTINDILELFSRSPSLLQSLGINKNETD